MQDLDWNDLKVALAVHRTGGLGAAARRLGVNETTVSRRIKALTRTLGAPLFQRTAEGVYRATEAGHALVDAAKAMERSSEVMAQSLAGLAARLAGHVRLSCTAIIANRFLTPRLASFHASHPDIRVDLLPDPRNISLDQRDADLAIRFARPTSGGLGAKTQRLGALGFSAFCAASVNDAAAGDLPWIGYVQDWSHLPQAQWLSRSESAQSAGSFLSVADAETAMEAAAAGLGKTLAPTLIGEDDPRLRRLPIEAALPERDVWLLSPADDSHHSAAAAMKAWLTTLDWL